ncbi:MAG: AI-2E family transporter [Verrucomicrobiales bacterium]|nr:AI-2E family transporter [Verrucomicrobiales bacterium]
MADTAQIKKQAGNGLRLLFSVACVVIIVTGLKASARLFVPVMLGVFLAMLSLPILNWLHARGLPRMLAVIATVFVDLLFLFVVIFLLSGVVGDLQSKSTEYAERFRRQAAAFSESMDQQLERLGGFWTRAGIQLSQDEDAMDAASGKDAVIGPAEPIPAKVRPANAPEMAVVLDTSIPTFRELFERYWDSTRVVGMIGQVDLVGRFTSFASQSVFALIVMIFLLGESDRFVQKVRDVRREGGPDLSRFQRTSRDIQKYLAIKTVASSATGFLAAISCYFFKVDFPLLWGLVAFLFNYVPAIGSIVAAIPPVVLALILHGFWPGVGVLACYLVINFTIGNFLEPIFMGERFGLSTVVVISSVLFWGFVWGPVGMLLAVPLTMIVKVMLDNSTEFRWISALMGKAQTEHEEPPMPIESPADEKVA